MSNTQKKNVPELRFPEFEGEWEEKTISSFLKESKIKGSNGSHAKKLTVKLWGKGVVPKKETFEGSDNTQYYKRKAGQLMYGKLDFLNCAFGIVPDSLNNYESTIDSPSFDFINGDSKFLLERIKLKSFYKKFGDIANGSRKAKRINQDTFLSLPVFAPKYDEQLRIGEFFSKLDRQIELEEQKLELLQQQKKGYMQKIFSQELRFKDENGEDYPDWTNENFKDLFKVVPSKKYQIKSSEIIESGKIPVVDQGKKLILGFSNETDKVYKEFNNVIIYGDHTTIIKKMDVPFIIGGDGVKLLSPISNNNLDYFFSILQYFNIESEGYKRHFSILKDKNFYTANSNKEQQKIGCFFKSLDLIINKQFTYLELLKSYKKGIIQKMFV
ncbi:TPA: restriction endonuclease subunit S [Staphylococcus argenteus]|uniref:restriction endonuclease subunit S n=1 Tax=Staphylococcus argenteus TaxID=985002 RepID=UPI000500F88F|nr:restriction endonuclease subunit S [Staphylococcus argenteus]MDT3006089.1 restriction endonuclease subunit S [Staphylococcus argenteus]UPO20059.1 restriction endonuclease subunit S [Staphylococcus argenteus]CDR63867.1 type I restriction-modification system S subunit [Staphylococcus argenteus]HDY9447120.1 restriction endonuclease subunit S [Staphylococcus argenteus]HDY9494703.1 restriction endonuclease subunit S [Staphylococcus argenteus]